MAWKNNLKQKYRNFWRFCHTRMFSYLPVYLLSGRSAITFKQQFMRFMAEFIELFNHIIPFSLTIHISTVQGIFRSTLFVLHNDGKSCQSALFKQMNHSHWYKCSTQYKGTGNLTENISTPENIHIHQNICCVFQHHLFFLLLWCIMIFYTFTTRVAFIFWKGVCLLYIL